MGSGEADLLEDAGGGGGGGGEGGGGGMTSVVSSSSPVSCSICLEVVTDNGERSRAKLYCGHVFHLDCIGSAFNAKGVMQCPNCRKIEKGQWLYANGCHSFPELRMEDWPHDEDLYDHLSYSEMSFGVHWCPFSGLTRVPSSFEKQGFWPSWPPGEDSFDSEEGESPSAAYHDLLGHRAIFAEHTAASSVAHSCPYVAYFQPVHSSSSNSSESVADGLSFSHHWNGLSASNDISTSHPFPSMDLHYHGWEHHPPSFSPSSSHISGADQAPNPAASLRSNRGDSDGIPRSGSFVRPILLSNGSGPRAGSSVISSMVPPYSSMNSRGHERIPGLRPYQQQPNSSILPPIHPSVRRSSGSRGLAPPVGPVAPSSDHTSGYILYPSSGSSGRSLQEAENPQRNRFYAWERDRFAPFPLIPIDRESSWWGPFPQASSGSDSSSRASNFWHRHGSERSSSQSRSENPPYQPVHPSGRMMHPFI